MAGSFPLMINGQTFSNLTLAGKKYLHNYPDLLSAVVEHSKRQKWVTAVVTISHRWFPRIGTMTVTFNQNLAIESGMLFSAYNDPAAENISPNRS